MIENIISTLITAASSQGFGYLLFVCLLLYVLWSTNKRELRLQGIVEKLSDTINIDLHSVREDIKEIKERL
jgi:hypothetical protein